MLYQLPGINQMSAILSISNDWDFPLQYAPMEVVTPAKFSQKQTELARKKKFKFYLVNS